MFSYAGWVGVRYDRARSNECRPDCVDESSKHQQISGMNIETAPLRLLSAIMEASAGGEKDPRVLAEMALVLWNSEGTISVH